MRRKIIDDYCRSELNVASFWIFMDITFFGINRVFNNFLLIDATDRSKISSDKKHFFIASSLYPLLFFANTPFNLGSVADTWQ